MFLPSVLLSAFCLIAGIASAARLSDGRLSANMRPVSVLPKINVKSRGPIRDQNGNVLPPTNTTYYFQQLIDHNNPSLGTFSQRYWHAWEFWKEGGCIVLLTPGEGNAEFYDVYLTNLTMSGMIAQQQNCATVVIEHRFYGFSNPKPDLSVDSLRLHTIDQAIADLDYFAKNVKLPMPGGDNVKPDRVPWVLVGGSYAGALTSFTMTKTNTFYAGYASSAVVESIMPYWGYFEPIRQNMAKNCSADIQRVIAHVDRVFSTGTPLQKAVLKSNWGLGALQHLDDVAGALRSNLWDWQLLSPLSGYNVFHEFCDALEVRNGTSAPERGWGLDHALQAWGTYWNTTYLSWNCGDESVVECFDTYNQTWSSWTNTSINHTFRSWWWIVCNEVGFFQDGAPPNVPTLVTRLVPPSYDIRQCTYMFPEAYKNGIYAPRVNITNAKYHGWDVREPHLFFGNGRNDPWKEATVSADNYKYPNSTAFPVGLSDGFHVNDLVGPFADADPSISAVQKQGLAAIKRWLARWPHPRK